ncbi:hypothetical protein HPT29_017475 [Microvirga terrae]|uniref:Plastocyanin-like domain-containing protein n=1 Tax=Microvirga terrae TaxID=2740529 RepID=A0ABY5RR74_9HYPH|nr:hypothetical protein [Microvirga terrae]UVF18292.1 hypothetical protein HPT29_017475 [Microvirga terrae]
MSPSRRHVLRIGGGLLAGLAWSRLARADEPVEIRMQGRADGSHVWFDPVGLHVEPGRTIRWLNLDPGNSHTATAYHPKNDEHPLRIPEGAAPWNSDYLLPHETFSVTLTVEGCTISSASRTNTPGWSGGSSSGVRAALLRTVPGRSRISSCRPSRRSTRSCSGASSAGRDRDGEDPGTFEAAGHLTARHRRQDTGGKTQEIVHAIEDRRGTIG